MTLALAYDIDAVAKSRAARRRTGRRGCPTTARPTPRRSSSWCARATPRGSRTGTTSTQARRLGDHAQPEDLGRRALELPGGLGLRAASNGGNDGQGARTSSRRLYKNVPVLDSGARGSTDHLRRARHRRRADRLGERGAARGRRSSGKDKFEIVAPSLSILAEPPVAVVDKVVDKHGTRGGRRGLPASSSTRPRARRSPPSTTTARATPAVAAKYAAQFPKVQLFTVDEVFGGWPKAQQTHFADGGVFDQIYGSRTVTDEGRLRWSGADASGERAVAVAGLGAAAQRLRGGSVLPGFGLTLGFTLTYLALIVLIPLSAVFLKTATLAVGELLGDGHRRRARSPPTGLSFGASLVAGRDQRASSACSSPGCWCATAFRASGWSTRWSICRSRCRRRWPASRSPRSTPRTAGSAAASSRIGIKVAYHAAGRRGGADLHRPAVRRAHGAAGARGPRPGGRGGGGEPGRRRAGRRFRRVILPDAAAGAAHRLRARLRARARRVRLGRLHLRQHADAKPRSRRC